MPKGLGSSIAGLIEKLDAFDASLYLDCIVRYVLPLNMFNKSQGLSKNKSLKFNMPSKLILM